MSNFVEVDTIVSAIERTLGHISCWEAWPGGWPGDIEAALVDAVYSARAAYRTRHGHGIHERVTQWRSTRPGPEWTLERLVDEIGEVTPSVWAKRFGNCQTSPGRPSSAPEGSLKAATVLEAASELIRSADIHSHSDITEANVGHVKAVLRSVPGIGYATTNYFLMLLGRPGVKPDRMIHRFITRHMGRKLSDRDAEALITAAAQRLGAEPHELEHAIWKRESDKAQREGGRGTA